MRSVNRFAGIALLQTALFLLPSTVRACKWDSTTLATEKQRRPDMAQVILGPPAKPEDLTRYRERITRLTPNRKEGDPMWWNDLAVAHMNLGELTNAVDLLQAAVKRFPDNYGVHANLGTTYHLLGRYAEAEKEIARDLEINPDAHFGLEKYHLALLQYLVRDSRYQSRHLYVDELTRAFVTSGAFLGYYGHERSPESGRTNSDGTLTATLAASATNAELTKMEDEYRRMPKTAANIYEASELLSEIIAGDASPPYAVKWDLAADPKLKEGVLYMASLNPKEPACFEMLGVVCLLNNDRHLAVSAFEKAIALGSPQKEILQVHIDELNSFMAQSRANNTALMTATVVGVLVILAVVTLDLVGYQKTVFPKTVGCERWSGERLNA